MEDGVTQNEFTMVMKRVGKLEEDVSTLLVSYGKFDSTQQFITKQLAHIELLLERNQKSLAERVTGLETNLAIRKDRAASFKLILWVLGTIVAALASLHIKSLFS